MAHVARAPGKFGRRLCVLSPCRLQPSMQHGNGESVWIQGGGGVGETQVHQHSAFSPFASVSLCVSLSDYLLLSLRAAVSVSQNGEGARSCLCRQHMKGQLGRAGTFNGPTPPASSLLQGPHLWV